MNIPKHEDILMNPRAFGKQSLIKYFKEFYDELQILYPDIDTDIEKLYLYLHNLQSPPMCYCGNKLRFMGYKQGYRLYCSDKCSAKDPVKKEKIKQTFLERYGAEYPSQINEFKEKAKQTNLERYGTEYPMQSEKIQEKAKQTNLERYGEDCYKKFNKKAKQTNLERYGEDYYKKFNEKGRLTKLERYGDENYNNFEKYKQTNLEKYGVEYAIAADKTREKIKQTFLERYGTEYPSQINEFKEKAKQTNLERYGAEYPMQSEKIQEKTKQTNLERYGVKTPAESSKIKLNIIKKFQNKYNVDCGLQAKILKKYPNIIGISDRIWVIKCPHPECNKCKEKCFETRSQIYRDRLKNNNEVCTKLLPINKQYISGTTTELFIRNILDEYNIEYQTNVRSIISPKELDIYIPSKQIAIECNGVYWHSSNKVAKKYHFSKYKSCEAKNIQLITIWEDQIKSKPDIIKSILSSKLGINHKIYARKCKIIQLNNQQCNDFLDQNHIQGACRSKYKYGLIYQNEIVAIMTFGNSRVAMGNKNDKPIELLRFCTKKYHTVVGGASKLLNYFIKEINPTNIISFSSNDISNGGLYETLGFNKSTENLSYWYIDPSNCKRYHRFNFAKFKLIDAGFPKQMTENEIMEELGFFKIFDCGQIKWELNLRR